VARPIVSPVLVGRELQLDTLGRALETARAGVGGAVLIAGEAGIGKSRLVAELHARAELLGCTVGRFFARIAADRALVVVFEDLHWSDEASLELLASLARVARSLRVLLLVTYRQEEKHPGLQRLLAGLERGRLATELVLAPLGLTDVETMIRLILDLRRPVRAELLHLVCRLTEGNPFFVEEILRSLPEAAAVGSDPGGRVVDTVPVPRTVQEAVGRQVDQLDAAVHFAPKLLRTITPRAPLCPRCWRHSVLETA
jgi:predicted ATPase